jgi:NAD(P)-dependent dehydrogenase (short-subunit alcohol dehydrogenase family)
MNERAPLRHTSNYPRGVLITGAAKRIGRALALDFAAQGWRVAAHYGTSRTEAAALIEEITAKGGKAVAVQADLSVESEVQSLIPRSVAAIGPLGCLINNASTFEPDTLATATRQSWDRHIEPNLRAPLVLSQGFARALEELTQRNGNTSEPNSGVIINLIDQRVWNPTPHYLSYSLSKAGLLTLTKTLALELAPRIRVNGIGPGPALPNARQSQADFDAQCASMPLGTGTSPEEICVAARFLLAAKSITGQMIALDGGEHLGWAQPTSDRQVLD